MLGYYERNFRYAAKPCLPNAVTVPETAPEPCVGERCPHFSICPLPHRLEGPREDTKHLLVFNGGLAVLT
jgi:hypothetical protein